MRGELSSSRTAKHPKEKEKEKNMIVIPEEKSDRKGLTTEDMTDIEIHELPTNHRPVGADDLGYGELDPEVIFELPSSIAEDPDLLPFWADVVRIVKNYPQLAVKRTSVVRPLLGKDIDQKILEVQERYDRAREAYHRTLNGGGGDWYSCNFYYSAEGLPMLVDYEYPA